MGSSLDTPEGMAQNITACAAKLAAWNSIVYGQISKMLQKKRKTLSSLAQQNGNGSLSIEINSFRSEINNLLDDEKLYWRQRSKVHWLREGDKNTKFFHVQTSKRRQQITISGLWNNNGVWCDEKESLV